MVKINFDGALFSKEQKSGIGVIIRDAQGVVLVSLSRTFSCVYSPFEVEGVVAASTLQLVFELEFQEVILEGDCQFLMHALKYDSPFLSTDSIILDVVRSKARCFSKLQYSHVKREGNKIDHVLARFALNVTYYRVWMEDVPLQIHSFVLADSDGIH